MNNAVTIRDTITQQKKKKKIRSVSKSWLIRSNSAICFGKPIPRSTSYDARFHWLYHALSTVPKGPPSRGGDDAVYVFDIKQTKLPTPFYSVLVSVSVFMAP